MVDKMVPKLVLKREIDTKKRRGRPKEKWMRAVHLSGAEGYRLAYTEELGNFSCR